MHRFVGQRVATRETVGSDRAPRLGRYEASDAIAAGKSGCDGRKVGAHADGSNLVDLLGNAWKRVGWPIAMGLRG